MDIFTAHACACIRTYSIVVAVWLMLVLVRVYSSAVASEAVVLQDEEMERFIDRSKALNTVKKTKCNLKKWCMCISQWTQRTYHPKELNMLLIDFALQ